MQNHSQAPCDLKADIETIERVEDKYRGNARLCEILRNARGELQRLAIIANARPLDAAE
jgi:hypothetical protein